MEQGQHRRCNQKADAIVTCPDNGDNSDLLEIYKLHSDLSDRVSQRRDGANRFYAGLLTFVGVSIGAAYKMDNVSLLLVAEIAGLCVSILWFVVIKSYRDLNTGKFKALQELESEFRYCFFQREWEILDMNKKKKRYLQLTRVEMGLPIALFILFGVLLVVTLINQ